jgi:hypothetical protein
MRFEVASKHFDMANTRFAADGKRFAITSERLQAMPKRINATPDHIIVTPNRFSLIKSRFQPADVIGTRVVVERFHWQHRSFFRKGDRMSVPLKDSLLVPWSTNFDTRITATPTTFGLTAAQATAYTALHDPFVAGYNAMMAARADGTRSEAQTAIKDAAKTALLAMARELYSFVQANTSVSDADKILLGVKPRDYSKSTISAPTARPGMDLVSVVARTVTVHIHDSASSSKRGKPAGAISAWVYTYVGSEYPSDPSMWQFQGAFNKPEAEIVFPDSVASGAQVWICAAWASRRGETGPVSVPITTNVQGGGVSASTANIKIAA